MLNPLSPAFMVVDALVGSGFMMESKSRSESESQPVICWMCQNPIPRDNMVGGEPPRTPCGEPLCLECRLDLGNSL